MPCRRWNCDTWASRTAVSCLTLCAPRRSLRRSTRSRRRSGVGVIEKTITSGLALPVVWNAFCCPNFRTIFTSCEYVVRQLGIERRTPVKPALRLLLLEDIEADAQVVERSVAAEWPNCEILRAASKADFEAALAACGFDAILSDYVVPGFPGLAALALARKL